MGRVMDEQDRRRRLFDKLEAEYAKLQEDPEAWRSLQDEQRVWEATLGDGLDCGESWGEDGAPEADPSAIKAGSPP